MAPPMHTAVPSTLACPALVLIPTVSSLLSIQIEKVVIREGIFFFLLKKVICFRLLRVVVAPAGDSKEESHGWEEVVEGAAERRVRMF